MEAEQSPTPEPAIEEPGGLRAIWANTLEPVAPLPWYRRTSPKALIAGAVVVGLFTALTVAVVTGAGDLPRHRIVLPEEIGYQFRLPEDESFRAGRLDMEKNLTPFRPYRELAMAAYGSAGSTEPSLTVIGLTGTFADARYQLDRFFAVDPVTGDKAVDRRDYPAGPLQGALDCAVVGSGEDSGAVCAWADGTTLGIVIDWTGELAPQDLAQRTLEIRAAVEVEAKD
ncbi:hypothetical protein [Streptomyces sp. CBMA156]|uniref:hypothetical protein n=1 Tax=Streptomyces sp. CBMA156 TaxID=1930280 RepID=UPI0016619E6F|nr:hypothetical protein [Streptomyces sp. CBMA156]MBD0672037.1 hypothetical protein [Streptomyces sp. CBMA156]MBD0676391.1 hypothetical protein [Streptomyces sp. CBMA156]